MTPITALNPSSALSGEIVVDKRVNSAFIGTDLETRLRNAEADHVVVVGLTGRVPPI